MALNATEFKKLVRPLLPAGPRWVFRGKLCYAAPANLVVLGVHMEARGDHVSRFAMPLYVPVLGEGALVLSHSPRMPSNLPADEAVRQALATLRNERDVIEELANLADLTTLDVRELEDMAHARAVLGDLTGALRVVDAAADLCHRFAAPEAESRDWEFRVLAQLALLGRVIRQDGRAGAEDLLRRIAALHAAAVRVEHEWKGTAAWPGHKID